MKINDMQHITKNGSVKRNPRKYNQELYEKTILNAINTDGFEESFTRGIDLNSKKGKLQFLKKRLLSEYGHEVQRYGVQTAMAKWYQGLAIDLPFYNWDIIQLAVKGGSLSPNATEREQEKIVLNYWNFMANITMKMFKKYKVE